MTVRFAPTTATVANANVSFTADGDTISRLVTGTGSAPFAVTVSKAGAGTGTVTSSPTGIDCGATCSANFTSPVTLTAVAGANSAFTGWSGGGCSGTLTCTVSVAATVTATFAPTFALTVSKAGSGTGTVMSAPAGINCGATCSTGFAPGTTVTLTAAPDLTSTFGGWSGGGCSGTASCVVTLSAATTVTANFTATFALTVSITGTGGGTVTSSPAAITCSTGSCSARFVTGTAVMLTATPGLNSAFTGWSGGGCSGTGTCVVTLSAATTVTAQFNSTSNGRILSVTVRGSATGTITDASLAISCGSTCAALYPNNTSVTLTPTAGTGGSFKQWGGSCSGSGGCTLMMNQPKSVTATFKAAYTNATITSGLVVKAVDITELRTAINTLRRQNFGLSAFSFTDPTLTAGMTIRAVHIIELRNALNGAYTAASLTPPSYTDPTITPGVSVIEAAHITELRDGVSAIE